MPEMELACEACEPVDGECMTPLRPLAAAPAPAAARGTNPVSCAAPSSVGIEVSIISWTCEPPISGMSVLSVLSVLLKSSPYGSGLDGVSSVVTVGAFASTGVARSQFVTHLRLSSVPASLWVPVPFCLKILRLRHSKNAMRRRVTKNRPRTTPKTGARYDGVPPDLETEVGRMVVRGSGVVLGL